MCQYDMVWVFKFTNYDVIIIIKYLLIMWSNDRNKYF